MVAFAEQIQDRAQSERIRKSQEMMSETRANMSDAEWSRIVD